MSCVGMRLPIGNFRVVKEVLEFWEAVAIYLLRLFILYWNLSIAETERIKYFNSFNFFKISYISSQ